MLLSCSSLGWDGLVSLHGCFFEELAYVWMRMEVADQLVDRNLIIGIQKWDLICCSFLE
jgi:hypothetical protein